MFGSLMGYKEQAYYEEHPTMTLYTPDGDYTIEPAVSYTHLLLKMVGKRRNLLNYLQKKDIER